MDAEILITSLNGDASAESKASGNRTATANRVIAARSALANKNPVGVVAQRNSANKSTNPRHAKKPFEPLFPVSMDPGHDVWIVDWFFVTDVWPEKRRIRNTMGIVWMVRLEKTRLGEMSYWAEPSQRPPPKVERDFLKKVPRSTCSTCLQDSPCIFNEGWICRNEGCGAFWMLGNRVPDTKQLTYSDLWLQQREWVNDVAPQPFYPDFDQWYQANYLAPHTRNLGEMDPAIIKTLSQNLLHGFCCPLCRRVNRRVEWSSWKCRTPSCPFERAGQPPQLDISEIVSFDDMPLPDFTKLNGYSSTEKRPGFKVYHYMLAEACRVSYFMPDKKTNQLPRSSDWFYDVLLRLANTRGILLRRVNTKSKSKYGIVWQQFALTN